MKAFFKGLFTLLIQIALLPFYLVVYVVALFVSYLQYLGGEDYTLLAKLEDYIELKKSKFK
jgi:hypothetical protein